MTNAYSTHLTSNYFQGIIDPRSEEDWGVIDSLEKHKKLVEHLSKDCLLRLTPKGYDLCKELKDAVSARNFVRKKSEA